MEAKGLDLWYTEEHSKEAKFSIKVLRQLYSVQSPFQKIDILESNEFGRFYFGRLHDADRKRRVYLP